MSLPPVPRRPSESVLPGATPTPTPATRGQQRAATLRPTAGPRPPTRDEMDRLVGVLQEVDDQLPAEARRRPSHSELAQLVGVLKIVDDDVEQGDYDDGSARQFASPKGSGGHLLHSPASKTAPGRSPVPSKRPDEADSQPLPHVPRRVPGTASSAALSASTGATAPTHGRSNSSPLRLSGPAAIPNRNTATQHQASSPPSSPLPFAPQAPHISSPPPPPSRSTRPVAALHQYPDDAQQVQYYQEAPHQQQYQQQPYYQPPQQHPQFQQYPPPPARYAQQPFQQQQQRQQPYQQQSYQQQQSAPPQHAYPQQQQQQQCLQQAAAPPVKFPSFGVNLEFIMQNQRYAYPYDELPRVFTTLVRMIRENAGLSSEGIFRLSGSVSEVARLKDTLNKGAFDAVFQGDCNTPACALKQWIAELAEPLVPRAHYASLVQCVQSNASDQVMRCVATFPAPNRATLCALLGLLQEVLQHADQNRMTLASLAIVFSPGVFGSSMTDPISYMMTAQAESRVFEAMMRHHM